MHNNDFVEVKRPVIDSLKYKKYHSFGYRYTYMVQGNLSIPFRNPID